MELYRIVIDSYSPPSVFCCSYRCKFLLLALFATLLYSLDGRCEEERERAAEAGVKELAPTISLLPRSYISLVHFGCQMECVEWGVGSGKESFLLFPSLPRYSDSSTLLFAVPVRASDIYYYYSPLLTPVLIPFIISFHSTYSSLYHPFPSMAEGRRRRWYEKILWSKTPLSLSLSLPKALYTPPLAIPKSKQVPFV